MGIVIWNKLDIPPLLKAGRTCGDTLLRKLRGKKRKSGHIAPVVKQLETVHGLSIRGPGDNPEKLATYSHALVTLYVKSLMLLNSKGGKIPKALHALDEFFDMVDQTISLMREIIANSETYLNYDGTPANKMRKLPLAVVGRMEHALRLPVYFGDEIEMKPINQWKTLRTGVQVFDAGFMVAEKVTKTSASASGAAQAAVTGGSATSGPIGMVAVSVAKTTVGHGFAARSAYKTNKHIKSLKEIKANLKNYPAQGIASDTAQPCCPLKAGQNHADEHDEIATTVLPYLIEQKERKFRHKVAMAVPLAAEVEGARHKATSAYDWIFTKKASTRKDMVGLLAKHFISCDCPLAQDIITELLGSRAKMEALKWDTHSNIVKALLPKFQDA